ncbi:MAG TPA: DUF5615 family PIN-like protein [Chthoniobacteraceae bacterium]|nr:DUF5615 family PIN-like protein [Chthoniobacteraceae bacterium]
MKLLFDEDLSPKLPRLLAAQFPASAHVRECRLKGRPDEEIWEYARQHGFVLVSKDSDFCERSLLFGAPPKLVWLQVGNCTREFLVNLLVTHESDIRALAGAASETVLVLL